MGANEQVLSQSAIDSMFSATASGPPEEVAENPPVPQPEPPIQETETGALTLDSVGKRLEKLEETVVNMGRQDGTPEDISAAVKQVQQDIQTFIDLLAQYIDVGKITVVADLAHRSSCVLVTDQPRIVLQYLACCCAIGANGLACLPDQAQHEKQDEDQQTDDQL